MIGLTVGLPSRAAAADVRGAKTVRPLIRIARLTAAADGPGVAGVEFDGGRGTGALAAGQVHVDLWAATQLDGGAAASSVRRRLSVPSSFYRYCAAHDLIGRVPTNERTTKQQVSVTGPAAAVRPPGGPARPRVSAASEPLF
jgi:hypothetical protein